MPEDDGLHAQHHLQWPLQSGCGPQILLTKEAAAGRMFWRFLPFYPLLHLVHSDGQPLVLIVTGITSLRSLVGLCLFD